MDMTSHIHPSKQSNGQFLYLTAKPVTSYEYQCDCYVCSRFKSQSQDLALEHLILPAVTLVLLAKFKRKNTLEHLQGLLTSLDLGIAGR